MSTRYEYYNINDDAPYSLYGVSWAAQTFTPLIAHKITSIKLKLERIGAPGTVTVSIRATDGSGTPTGGDLCSGSFDGNYLPEDPNWEWREITLGNGAILSANTMYAIVVRNPGGDLGNRIRWAVDETSPTYDRGTESTSMDSGVSWAVVPTYDLMFEEWGDPLAFKGARGFIIG
jgi:hypothetical protein